MPRQLIEQIWYCWYCQLLLLLLLLSSANSAQAVNSTVATFNLTHSFNFVETTHRLSLRFRSSHPNNGTLLSIVANDSLSLLVGIDSRVWFNESQVNDSGSAVVTDGEWHTLSIDFTFNGSVLVDDSTLLTWPTELSDWEQPLNVTVGLGVRGCIANVTGVNEETSEANESELKVLDAVNPSVVGCQPDACRCSNNATCTQSQWSIYTGCVCTTGFEGELCELESDTCRANFVNSTCQNGGLCINLPGVNNYRCNCTSDYTGENCTLAVAMPVGEGEKTNRSTAAVVVPIVLVVLAAFVAAVVLSVRYVRQRRKDVGVYKPSERELHSKYGLSLDSVLKYPNVERLI